METCAGQKAELYWASRKASSAGIVKLTTEDVSYLLPFFMFKAINFKGTAGRFKVNTLHFEIFAWLNPI